MFYAELTKIISNYHQILPLIYSSVAGLKETLVASWEKYLMEYAISSDSDQPARLQQLLFTTNIGSSRYIKL